MQLFNCKMETKSDMKNMTIWNIARACKGHLAVPAGKHTGTCPAAGMAVIRGYSGKEAAGIVIDSRKVEPGDIFVRKHSFFVSATRQSRSNGLPR